MSALLATRSARRRGIAFTILVALTLVLMAFSSNPAVVELQRGISFAFQPAQRAFDGAAAGVASVFQALGEIDRLRTDNALLRDENARLKVENGRLAEIRRENEILTGLLQLRSGLEFETVAAQVIARESSEFRRLVTLDKGTAAGIGLGDVVVAQGGALAGRVVEVGANFAKVMLITDGGSTVIGQLSSSAATGEVVGQLRGELIMTKIDSTETVLIDEEVVTAGLELNGVVRSPFPKGLLIGQVVDIRRDANDVVQTAYLRPAVNLDKLEYLLVITDYEGGLPPVDQIPTDCSNPDPSEGTLPDGEQPCITPTPTPGTSVAPGASDSSGAAPSGQPAP